MKINVVLEVKDPNQDVCIDMTGSKNVQFSPCECPPQVTGLIEDIPSLETKKIGNFVAVPGNVPVPTVRGVSFKENPTQDGFMNLEVNSMEFDSEYLESNTDYIRRGYITNKPWFPSPLWVFKDQFGNDIGLIAKDLGNYAKIVHGI